MSLIKFLLAPTKALNLYMVKKISFYLKFLFQGTNKYNIHSPLVHDMIENILDNSIKYYSFVGIEHVRSLLLKQTAPIELKDLGVEEQLINLKGMTQGMLVILGQKNIKKLNDFADLSSDELIGGYDEIKGKKIRIEGYLEEFSLSRKEADDLIMAARDIAYK